MDVLKTSKKIVNHIHIPLQSGCDKILKAMNRKYDMQYFINKINQIRSIRKDIAITSDVIVGFPGETDEDFNITKENIKKIKFTELHVFPYSKREGTPAAIMKNQIDGNIKKQRVKELIEVSEELKNEYYKNFIGKSLEVLVETYSDGYLIISKKGTFFKYLIIFYKHIFYVLIYYLFYYFLLHLNVNESFQ